MKIVSELSGTLRRYFNPAVQERFPSHNREGWRPTSVSSLAIRHETPGTPTARHLAALIDASGSVRFDTVVEQVARQLYQEELSQGAAVLDIGVFGSRLFYREVIAELCAGDGVYWKIQPEGLAR